MTNKTKEVGEERVENEFNFDLPEIESTPITKPRLHFTGESVCTSCEG